MHLRSDVAVGQYLVRQALSLLKFYKRKRVLSRAALSAANATSALREYPEERFFATWGSRGSATTNKVAFQQSATSNENHVFLAMTLFLHLRYKTLDLLQIHFFYSIYPYCLRAIKFFDREGWVVGVVVRASTFYIVNKSVGHY